MKREHVASLKKKPGGKSKKPLDNRLRRRAGYWKNRDCVPRLSASALRKKRVYTLRKKSVILRNSRPSSKGLRQNRASGPKENNRFAPRSKRCSRLNPNSAERWKR